MVKTYNGRDISKSERVMEKCKECDREYEKGIKEFCSEECFKKNIQKRVKEATEDDTSHTKKISNGNSC